MTSFTGWKKVVAEGDGWVGWGVVVDASDMQNLEFGQI